MQINPGSGLARWHCAVAKWLLFSLVLLLSSLASAQQGTVRSELSSSTITLDESVTLSVVAIGVDGELDSSALNEKFDVVGRSSSRQVSTIVSGGNQPALSSVITWTLELMPREAGVFTVPAVSVGGVSSQLLSLTVNDTPAGAKRDVFVEATVDTRTPWVQSQVLMTIRVFQGIEIVDGALSDPAGQEIQVQRIGKDKYSSEIREGRQYSVTERQFAIFPQKSGTLVMDPVILTISVPADRTQARGLFSATRKLTRRTESLTLNVQARPPAGMAWWLPASGVMLESSWAGGKVDARVGQPLTRIVTLRGFGVLDSQLPEVSIPAIDGVSLYAEEPVKSMGFNERGLVAEQIVKWALIPQREGELVLPSVSIEWFNTDTGQMETALLPAEKITVGPSAAAADKSPADPLSSNGASGAVPDSGQNELKADLSGNLATDNPDSSVAALSAPDSTGDAESSASVGSLAVNPDSINTTDPADAFSVAEAMTPMERLSMLESSIDSWRTFALALLAVWIATVAFYWWRSRRHAVRGQLIVTDVVEAGQNGLGELRSRASAAYLKLAPLTEVEAACKAVDPGKARQALLDWASRRWPDNPPGTLTALASLLEDDVARETVEALDASLYSRAVDAAVSTELMGRLRELPRRLAELSARNTRRDTPGERSGRIASPEKRGRGLPGL